MILAFDSSAKTASCAVCEEGKVLCETCCTTGLTHSQTLLPMAQAMLEYAGLALEQMQLLAVSSGPGSFTGLRIGLAAVKGIAQPLGLRCVGVSTLEALAENLAGTDCIVCAAMDARRAQVYNALFSVEGGAPRRLCPDRALSIQQLGQELRQAAYPRPVVLVGDGAELCYNALHAQLPIRLAAPQNRLQRAASVGLCGLRQQENAVPPAALMPHYLRLSQAERMRAQKSGG